MQNDSFISGKLKTDEEKIDSLLHINDSFDLLKKNTVIGGRKAVMYYINGFCKDDVMQRIERFFAGLKPEDINKNATDFSDVNIPYLQVNLYNDEYNIITFILSGVVCLLIDGYKKALLIDAREYPARNVQEPEKYKVLRGSRDGFVETLILNTALIRRRIRNPEYVCEVVRAGKSSRTDIAICYMRDRVDKKLLNRIKKQINEVTSDALSMNQRVCRNLFIKDTGLIRFRNSDIRKDRIL